MDDALGDAGAGCVIFLGAGGLLAEELGQGETEPAEEADVEKLAAGGVAVERISRAARFHDLASLRGSGWKIQRKDAWNQNRDSRENSAGGVGIRGGRRFSVIGERAASG